MSSGLRDLRVSGRLCLSLAGAYPGEGKRRCAFYCPSAHTPLFAGLDWNVGELLRNSKVNVGISN